MSINVPYDPEGEKIRLKTMLRQGFIPSADGRMITVSDEVAGQVLREIEADNPSGHHAQDGHDHDEGQAFSDPGM